MTHIFISFSGQDEEFALELSAKIKSRTQLDTWLYTEKLPTGTHWKADIDQAIRDCYALVLVITPASKESIYVMYEWAMALGLGKPVLPILLKDTEEFHPRLENIQYEKDFRSKKPWGQFIRDLQGEVEAYTAYTIRVPREAPRVIHNTVALLDSADSAERKSAIDQLAKMNHPSILPILTEALRFVAPDVRELAANRLGGIGNGNIVPDLIKVLSDRESIVRQTAADALGRIGDASAVDALINVVKNDSHPNVREDAIRALGNIGDHRALQHLADALHDPDHGIRRYAVDALTELGPESVSALADAFKQEQVMSLCVDIVRAIGKIGNEEARAFLIWASRYRVANVREAAVEALGDIGNPHTVPVLIGALRDDNPNVRRKAEQALEKIGTPEALAAIGKGNSAP